mmetsp:Transcript_82619/g.223844  ORF Transcript_82619/g.223844 Transcript_82619/m.223844 type:complete len:463 (-) Transcript_82619:1331-2719(-)
MLLELEHREVGLHVADGLHVPGERLRVLVHEEGGPHVGEEVHGTLDLVAWLDGPLQVQERGQRADPVVPRQASHGASCERHEHHLLPCRQERAGRPVGQLLKLLCVQEAVHRSVHLRVAASERARQRHPRPVPAVRATVHLDEAGAVGRHHHLAVRGPVLDLQRIQHAADVGDHGLRLRGVRCHRQHAVVHERGAVHGALVVHPDHHRLVHAVPRHVVHHVLLALQELLAQHRGALAAHLLLRAHQNLEVLARLLLRVAQLHAVGASRLHRLHHHRHLLGPQELLHVLQARAPRLAHRPKPRRLHELLLDLLVAALRDLCPVGAHAQVLGQRVRQRHARLAAYDHGRELKLTASLPDGLACLLHGLLLGELRVVNQLATALRLMRRVAQLLGGSKAPDGYDFEAALEALQRHACTCGVRVHDNHRAYLLVRAVLGELGQAGAMLGIGPRTRLGEVSKIGSIL